MEGDRLKRVAVAVVALLRRAVLVAVVAVADVLEEMHLHQQSAEYNDLGALHMLCSTLFYMIVAVVAVAHDMKGGNLPQCTQATPLDAIIVPSITLLTPQECS